MVIQWKKQILSKSGEQNLAFVFKYCRNGSEVEAVSERDKVRKNTAITTM